VAWKRPEKIATVLLAAWAIATGLLTLLDVASPVLYNLNAILAVAVGVFLLLDK
jgi:hypothetical protein